MLDVNARRARDEKAFRRIRAFIAADLDRRDRQPGRYWIRSQAQLARDIAATPADHVRDAFARLAREAAARLARPQRVTGTSAANDYRDWCLAHGVRPDPASVDSPAWPGLPVLRKAA